MQKNGKQERWNREDSTGPVAGLQVFGKKVRVMISQPVAIVAWIGLLIFLSTKNGPEILRILRDFFH